MQLIIFKYPIHTSIGLYLTFSHSSSIAFIRRIMLDIDDDSDLQYMIKQNEKPEFIEKISSLSS